MHADLAITLPRATAPRVSILVVAARVGPRLLHCLESVALAAPGVAFDTTVLLNGVGEDAASGLRDRLAGVRVEAFATNLGLAGVLNRGREFVRGEFLVVLQDDTEVRSGWLEELVAAADRDPGAGAVGSLVLNPDGSVQTAGYELTPDFSTQPPWGARTPDPEEFDAVRAVDYCGSCSLLVRTDMWDRIGGADERLFPLYPVDIDLCLAIRMRGQRVLCAPASVLVHERGASITPDYAAFVQQRNRKLMLEKWGPALEGHVPGSGAVSELAPADLPLQVREADPDRQALAQLIRAGDTLDDYARDLRSRLAGREAEVAAVWERNVHLEAWGAELEERNRNLEERNRNLEERNRNLEERDRNLEERNAELRSALAEHEREAEREHAAAISLAAEVAWLRERSDTLTRVEGGGWWRLRRRLLPALRLAGAARRLFEARR